MPKTHTKPSKVTKTMATIDNFYFAAFRRWCEASAEEKCRLLRTFPDHAKLLPPIKALRDDPENVIMQNGRRLADCDPTELSDLAEYFTAVRDAALIRDMKIKSSDVLTGIRI